MATWSEKYDSTGVTASSSYEALYQDNQGVAFVIKEYTKANLDNYFRDIFINLSCYYVSCFTTEHNMHVCVKPLCIACFKF